MSNILITRLVGGPLDGQIVAVNPKDSGFDKISLSLTKRTRTQTHATYIWTQIGNSFSGGMWILRHNRISAIDALRLLIDSYNGATTKALQLRRLRRAVKNKIKAT